MALDISNANSKSLLKSSFPTSKFCVLIKISTGGDSEYKRFGSQGTHSEGDDAAASHHRIRYNNFYVISVPVEIYKRNDPGNFLHWPVHILWEAKNWAAVKMGRKFFRNGSKIFPKWVI